MKYRLIAKVLGIEINMARNATRSCEKKREHFQLLYDTGRLCGFRAITINALQAGQSTSEELANRAFAHLESCASCRAEHGTNAGRLRSRFQGQAAILLPMPAFVHRLGWLTRLDAKARVLQHRLAPEGLPLGPPGGVRERAIALLAGTGAATKLAAGLATVAVIAGGTVGATHILDHRPGPSHHSGRTAAPLHANPLPPQPVAAPPTLRTPAQHGTFSPRARPTRAHRSSTSGSRVQREPGGFAYLGVPTKASSTPARLTTRTASQSGGGVFSP
jgi:hypothetical protein